VSGRSTTKISSKRPFRRNSAGGERLFQLVDPKYDRRHLLGGSHRPLEVPLAIADVLVVEIGRVELEERHVPLGRDRFRREALPAARNAQQEHASREVQSELFRSLGLGDDRLSLGQLRFEAPQISDLREGGLHRVVLQQAIPLDYGDLCLDHMLDVLERELPIFDDGLRQYLPGLHE